MSMDRSFGAILEAKERFEGGPVDGPRSPSTASLKETCGDCGATSPTTCIKKYDCRDVGCHEPGCRKKRYYCKDCGSKRKNE